MASDRVVFANPASVMLSINSIRIDRVKMAKFLTFSKLRILLTVLGLGLLGVSILLNVLLYEHARKYYLEVNATRLDPVGLSFYPINSQEITNNQTVRVVFWGDSRAANWPAPEINGYEFINRGIGSQTSIQVLQRFSAHVRSLNPDVVIIQVGINDLKTIALFPNQRESIVTNCRANLQQMVEESRRLGAVVIITTIFPAGKIPLIRQPFWSDQIGRAVQEINAFITTLADDQVIVLDAFSILADSQGLMLQKYRMDELHLNSQGYAILNQELVRLMRTLDRLKARKH